MAFNIGAIPTIYVGGLPNHCSIRGMILVSPMLDFMKKKFDYDYINEVICPVFIIQGEFENNMDKQKIIEFTKAPRLWDFFIFICHSERSEES